MSCSKSDGGGLGCLFFIKKIILLLSFFYTKQEFVVAAVAVGSDALNDECTYHNPGAVEIAERLGGWSRHGEEVVLSRNAADSMCVTAGCGIDANTAEKETRFAVSRMRSMHTYPGRRPYVFMCSLLDYVREVEQHAGLSFAK